ncbi:MAG TPA: hypothetical protein VH325_07895 [Bryobacteraceae bacterium]|nr:hypothetical protein [Bryobacteraceae bacterium]
MKFLLACLLALQLHAELVDKLAITIGQQVITELQLDEELRVTALLNKQPVVRDTATRRAAADRLVQQLLIKKEMDMSRYPPPTDAELNKYYEGVVSQFAGNATFEAALKSYELTPSTIKNHLTLQLITLLFIQYRFRPAVDISDQEIANAYQREIQNWTAMHSTPPPPLRDLRDQIVETITSQRVDYALSAWLEEARKRVDILYLDKDLE